MRPPEIPENAVLRGARVIGRTDGNRYRCACAACGCRFSRRAHNLLSPSSEPTCPNCLRERLSSFARRGAEARAAQYASGVRLYKLSAEFRERARKNKLLREAGMGARRVGAP